MPAHDTEKREIRYCASCGKKLKGRYYYRGYCAGCRPPQDVKLTKDALAAQAMGISYGKYMAMKYEEKQRRSKR